MRTEHTTWTVAGEERESWEAAVDVGLRLRSVGRPAAIALSGYLFYDERESVHLSFRGPRGGYRHGSSVSFENAWKLRHALTALAGDLCHGYVVSEIRGEWDEWIRLETDLKYRRWLVAEGPRAERERVQLTSVDCTDLSAALRFILEELEPHRAVA